MKATGLILSAAALAAFAGCRTTKDVLDDYEKNVSVGNYSAATEEVAKLAVRDDDSRLLWNLLTGAGFYMSGDKSRAISYFDAAEDAMQRNDQTSVFAQSGEGALAMMTNDRAFAYDGGGQDRIFACLYKAVDYMTQDRPDSARTELNRAAQHQDNWLWQRKKDVAAAAQKLSEDAAAYEREKNVQVSDRDRQTASVLADASFSAQIKERCAFDPATSGNLDALSAADYSNVYAMHVAGVFRWLNGDGGGGLLDNAAALVPGNAVLAADAKAARAGTKPVNRVWVWVEDGLCPVREEWRVDLPLVLVPLAGRYVMYAGMALPYLRERSFGAASWSVTAGGASTPMADLANVDRLVKTEYDVYMRGALTREITRTVVKIGVQAALGAAAENSGNRDHALALRLAQIGVATWAASTTAADLRSWTSLPKTVKAAGFARPADGVVDLVADGRSYRLNVPEGNTLVFVRKPAPSTGPTFKMVTFK